MGSGEVAMLVLQGLFAVACVSDMAASEAWYEKLLGRPADDHPMPTLTQWRWGPAGIQLVHDADRAGKSLMTIVVPEMSATRRALASRGIAFGDDMQGDFGIIAQIDDPDGNRITLAEPPRGFAS
ncbi:VOC family protein [Sphingoaurantiacus capsulatus]|uniref:VOC family protein n=1 Tax=Sphingoaurantiacus capsulatus TaxID=1771310 RepID=A0ABV7XAU1_9SPHN